jgi:hypothetical protein
VVIHGVRGISIHLCINTLERSRYYDWKNFSTDAIGTQILPIQHKTIHQLGMRIAYTF